MARRRLKVFQAQLGFYDTVVAAPNQAAALRAWGVKQNLFASGEARVTTEEAAVAAATACPETPLRRAVGSKDAFTLETTSLPAVPDLGRKAKSRPAARKKPERASRPPANRSRLDAAEQALAELNENRKREEAAFRREEEALDARRTAAQGAYVVARKAATAKIAAARTAYRKAGGTD